MVIASGLVHQENDRSYFVGRPEMSSSPTFGPHKFSDGLFQVIPPHVSRIDEIGFLEDNIIKAESISYRLGEFTSLMKSEGNDVERMETLLREYNLLVEDARMNFELANDQEYASDMTKQEYLDLSFKSIMRSNMLLKNIFDEHKPYMSRNIVFVENTSFIAKGSGMVMLSGDFDVNLSVTNGNMSYGNIKNDFHIKFEDDAKPSAISFPDARQKMISYENINGNISFSGSNYDFVVFGENMSMFSSGTGRAQFFGKGYYEFNNVNEPRVNQTWALPILKDN
jgi:hypothetical protein